MIRRGFLFFVAAAAAMFALPAFPSVEDGKKDVVLDAEKVVYDEPSGMAEAEGNALLTHDTIRIRSWRMELDTVGQLARATSRPGEKVTVHYGANRFTGDELEYDLNSREGVLKNASGDLPAGKGTVFLRGKNLEVVPFTSAIEKEWLKKSQARKIKDQSQEVAKWSDVSLTTCSSGKPHYSLTTKRLVVVPGVRVIARTPRVYIGGRLLFTYPFDYVVPLHKEKDALLGIFVPSVVYDSDKGMGYALAGPFAWDSGELQMAFRYWSEVDMESRMTLKQRLGKGTSIFAGVEYSYDKDTEAKVYRPSWGVRTSRNGWRASLEWRQREKLEIVKSFGDTYRNVLHREPEYTITSPWWKLGSLSGFTWRVGGIWGEYEVAHARRGSIPSSSRFVGNIQAQYIGKTGAIRPFWRGQYRYFSYSGSEETQEVSSMWIGLRTQVGELDFAAAWFSQGVKGRSPMSWDRASKREDVYAEVGTPLGADFYFSARAGYDVYRSRLGEMAYRFVLDHDCSQWELVYRDDQVGKDDWVGLRFIVKAFPETPLVFGEQKLSKPFPEQGAFPRSWKGAERKTPSMVTEGDEFWGDDGLASRTDPSEILETGGEEVPGGETSSGEDGDL